MELKTYAEWMATPGVGNDWDSISSFALSCGNRRDYHQIAAWFIVTKEVVGRLAEKFAGKKVVELGCGSGYLMKHLRDRGVDIVGYDIYENYDYHACYVDDIIQEDYTKVDLSGFDIILMTWPSMTDSANTVIRTRMHKGQQLYVEGEINGCTANDAFFDAIEEMDQDTTTARWLNEVQPQWDGIHDMWMVLTR